MRRQRRNAALVSVVAAAALALAACGGSSGGGSASSKSSSGGKSAAKTGYNAANANIVNPSTKAGGVLRMADSDVPDSFDPGNTYYAFVWDASRLWARSLTSFRPLPGNAGLKLVPDMATGLGKATDGGKTYTYTIRPGLKYSDGSPITTADIKYAIERSNYAPDVLSNGPTYFHSILTNNPGAGYQGPYKDKTGNLKSIETPNATTIVFHLAKPFADFDYLVSNPQTAPVPKAKDTGADYVKNIISSGSYEFKSYNPNTGAVLVRNPNWSASSDPLRKQYPAEIDIKFKQEATGIDQDLLAGNLDVDITGAGVQPASQASIIGDPTKKANADDALSGALAYMAISDKVKPLDNINCRQAIEYGVNKVATQNAYGGPLKGDIASTVLPPNITGYQKFDLYPSSGSAGDVTKAKAALKACGKPNGFSIGLSARADRSGEIAMAVAIQASLKKIGVNVTLQKYPSGKYFSDNAGAPAFVHSHNLGLMMTAWGADWPSGYGFLSQIVDGGAIKASGNSNLSELNDPKVNSLLATAIQNTDASARQTAWGAVDKQVMTDAAIVPLLYRKDLLYRPTGVTNVTVTAAYGMYDYLTMGKSS